MTAFLQWLDQWLAMARSIGNPWAVTVICGGLVLLGAQAGIFQTATPARIEALRRGEHPLRMFGFVSWEALTDAVFYGLLTLLVLR